MTDAPASIESVYAVARALASARIEFAYIGGVAVVTWGLPRQTFDLDVAVALSEPDLDRMLRAFVEHGMVVDDVFRSGFRDRVGELEKIQVNLPVGRSLLALDVFVANSPFVHSVLARKVSVDLGQGPIHICTAADVILFKLVAHRRKDLLDISNILTVQGVPDRRYLERWADSLGVRERLEQAIADFERETES